jgi:methylmalonyl-CoA/ethylmalonyl-CoA epimerase
MATSEEGAMSGTTRLQLSGIGQIGVMVKDLEAAVAFYRDILDLSFLFQVPNMAFFDCGGVRLMLGVADKAELDHPPSILYYRVDDIQSAHRTLAERGVAFEQAPVLAHQADDHDLWLAFFCDMEGNLLALMSEVPRS